jgi:hypothetical protein
MVALPIWSGKSMAFIGILLLIVIPIGVSRVIKAQVAKVSLQSFPDYSKFHEAARKAVLQRVAASFAIVGVIFACGAGSPANAVSVVFFTVIIYFITAWLARAPIGDATRTAWKTMPPVLA